MSISELQVENKTFLIDRLASDCPSHQQYRELTKNSIEAIQRVQATVPDFEGQILFDVNWPLYEEHEVYKLCISDNGDGMAPDEIRKYINHLSSSGGVQSLEANYGIGGKITAGYQNPLGVLYDTWLGGAGTHAKFCRHPELDVYGLERFALDEDETEWSNTPPADDTYRPDFVQEHGTRVTLLGRDVEHNTAQAPKGMSYPTHWLSRYLNSRFFRFPESITVRVRSFSKADPAEWPTEPVSQMAKGSQLRTVRGMEYFLDQVKADSGTIDIGDALVRWYLLDKEKNDKMAGQDRVPGMVGALYQDEIYESYRRQMLVRFGIYFGHGNVAILVEPKNGSRKITSTTGRDALRIDGEPCPWDEWAKKFQEKMPGAISAMMKKVAAESSAASHGKTISERLKGIRHLFRLTRYKKTAGGPVNVSGSAPGGSSKTDGGPPPTPDPKPNPKPPGPGKSGKTLGGYVTKDGTPATPISPKPNEPEVIWVGGEEALADRAAEYIHDGNLIKANKDFRVYCDMISHWGKQYAAHEGSAEVVVEVVREWFEQQLVEAVLGAQALQGSKEWDDEDELKLFSPEALTLSVMPRFHVNAAVRRTLGAKLGGLK